MFTRAQQVSGGMLAALIYGTFLGVVFAFACAVLWPRLPGATAFSRSIRLAVVAFVAWVLVPNLKYPANPPAVGDPDTVGQRTASYLLPAGRLVDPRLRGVGAVATPHRPGPRRCRTVRRRRLAYMAAVTARLARSSRPTPTPSTCRPT